MYIVGLSIFFAFYAILSGTENGDNLNITLLYQRPQGTLVIMITPNIFFSQLWLFQFGQNGLSIYLLISLNPDASQYYAQFHFNIHFSQIGGEIIRLESPHFNTYLDISTHVNRYNQLIVTLCLVNINRLNLRRAGVCGGHCCWEPLLVADNWP